MRALVILVVLASGCAHSVDTLALVAPNDLGVPVEVVERHVTARLCLFEWHYGQHPTVEDLVEKALLDIPEANAMANVAILHTTYPYDDILWPFVPDRNCLSLRGDAVRIGQERE